MRCDALRAAGLALVLLLAPGAFGQPRTPGAGTLADPVACAQDPTQTYSLYLPARYAPERRWPLLLVLDPRGRGRLAAEIFREAAEEFGWVVASSNDTRSDSGGEPNARALRAMWPDVPAKVSIDPRRIYAAGFSGTVTVAFRLAQATSQVAGIIGTGGGLPDDVLASTMVPGFFGAAGRRDFNYLDTRSVDAALARRPTTTRLEFFDGAHEWFGPELARLAVSWMEVVAMRAGLRERDESIVARSLALERARAEALERDGRPLEALNVYRSVVESYAGLAEIAFAEQRVRELDADTRVRDARRAEKRWTDWEARLRPEVGGHLTRLLREETFVPPRQAAGDLGLPALKERAGRGGPEGEAARRVLEWLFVQSSFYLWRDLMEREAWSRAVFAQSLALEIDASAPVAWFRLAASHARAGQKHKALEALERAVAAGFGAVDALTANDDFASLRDDPAFAALIERLRRSK